MYARKPAITECWMLTLFVMLRNSASCVHVNCKALVMLHTVWVEYFDINTSTRLKWFEYVSFRNVLNVDCMNTCPSFFDFGWKRPFKTIINSRKFPIMFQNGTVTYNAAFELPREHAYYSVYNAASGTRTSWQLCLLKSKLYHLNVHAWQFAAMVVP